MTGMATRVTGVDGCPDGWICADLDIDANGQIAAATLRHAAGFAGVLETTPQSRVIAVDMPIGLPERVGRGGRPPETAVRPLLGERQSSVFAIPARAAVYAADYATACAEALKHSDPPRKVSKQAFNLFAKIREIDALMSPQLQARVFECHPETVFMQANGGEPAPLPKKIKSRVNPDGLAWRRALLRRDGIPPDLFTQSLPRGVRHGADDIVDAAACALTAWRIHRGIAVRYPDDPVHDGRGLDMAIWA